MESDQGFFSLLTKSLDAVENILLFYRTVLQYLMFLKAYSQGLIIWISRLVLDYAIFYVH